ncbi:uncharacterized protein BXZ73DRAFT_45573 [Epithele typhae]|uniref:uncharacterized protein n=1 Tax=Epithele typhae TaxID=378194 RepID=UPI0020073BB2|nr:uncharacterized protein BXZ73DRAFT_45573 [Epithele typhae]KAH9935102.1 hypothetical protein BXZ73DRAFT_45573 [Epithele typhae]
MVLAIVYSAVTTVLPFKYWPHAAVGTAVLVVLYAYAQGRTTNRERDLHARVIVLTGAFNPLGLVALAALAKRGATVIALSPYPLDHPVPSLLLPLLRSTTNNDSIYAEPCDLNSATSIRKFCTTFLTGNDTRIDAIVLAHEYTSIGRIWFFGGQAQKDKEKREEEQRESTSLSSFLLITLLLPALLVAPVERDVRIISIVNPFYAAALPTFPAFLNSTATSPAHTSTLLSAEGLRSLRTVILTRHLQRILDSLPNRASDAQSNGPPASSSSKETPPLPPPHPSNILSVTACPGMSRRDIVAPLVGTGERGWSLAYLVLVPFLLFLTKSSNAAIQTLLHVLFLPTPLKRMQAKVDLAADEEARKAEEAAARKARAEDGEDAAAPASEPGAKDAKRGPPRVGNVEVLKPGALYRECAIVRLDVPVPPRPVVEENEPKSKADGKKGKAAEAEIPLEDDGEFGGEAVGRAVWEWYEVRLKDWEARDKERVKAEEEAVAKEKAEAEAEANASAPAGPTVVVTEADDTPTANT